MGNSGDGMRAGQLRHCVDLLRRVAGKSVLGEPSTVFEAYETDVYADVSPITAKEYQSAGHIISDTDTTITIRWRPDVLSIHRVRHDTGNGIDVYEVVAPIQPKMQNRDIQLQCKLLKF